MRPVRSATVAMTAGRMTPTTATPAGSRESGGRCCLGVGDYSVSRRASATATSSSATSPVSEGEAACVQERADVRAAVVGSSRLSEPRAAPSGTSMARGRFHF